MLVTNVMKQVNDDDDAVANDSSPQPSAQMEIVQDGLAWWIGRVEIINGEKYKFIS